jgi:hypothetical protein
LVEETDDNHVLLDHGASNSGAPAEFPDVPGTPADWSPPARKVDKNEPLFGMVDNPGNWTQFTFRSEFESAAKGGMYKQHVLPTGCTPLPKNDQGERQVGGWELHYRGYIDTPVDQVPESLVSFFRMNGKAVWMLRLFRCLA